MMKPFALFSATAGMIGVDGYGAAMESVPKAYKNTGITYGEPKIYKSTSEYLIHNYGIGEEHLDKHMFQVGFGDYSASGQQYNNITHGDLLMVPPFIRWDARAVPVGAVLLLDIDAPGPRGPKKSEACRREDEKKKPKKDSGKKKRDDKKVSKRDDKDEEPCIRPAPGEKQKADYTNHGKWGPWLHWMVHDCENGDIDDWCCYHTRMYSDPFVYPPLSTAKPVPEQNKPRGNHRFVALLFNHTKIERQDLRSRDMYHDFNPGYYPDGKKPPGWAQQLQKQKSGKGPGRSSDDPEVEKRLDRPNRFPIDIANTDLSMRYPLKKFMDLNKGTLKLVSYTTWMAGKDEKYGGVKRIDEPAPEENKDSPYLATQEDIRAEYEKMQARVKDYEKRKAEEDQKWAEMDAAEEAARKAEEADEPVEDEEL